MLTQYQYTELIALVSQHRMDSNTYSTIASSSIFMTGDFFSLFSSCIYLNWIIDSGDTDYMTPHLNLFSSINAQ